MRRSAELAGLSRQHHVALEHALRLRRATSDDATAVVERFLAFMDDDGERHFAAEEDVLLPVLAGEGEAHAERLRIEHRELRERVAQLRRSADVAAVAATGELLSAHVRFEERELFPHLERTLTPAALGEVGRRLDERAQHG